MLGELLTVFLPNVVPFLWFFFIAAILLGFWLYSLREKRERAAFTNSAKLGLFSLMMVFDIVLLTALLAVTPFSSPDSYVVRNYQFQLTIGISVVLYVAAVAFGKRAETMG